MLFANNGFLPYNSSSYKLMGPIFLVYSICSVELSCIEMVKDVEKYFEIMEEYY